MINNFVLCASHSVDIRFLSVIKMVSNGQVCVGKLTVHKVPLKCLLYKPKHTLKTHTRPHISASLTLSLSHARESMQWLSVEKAALQNVIEFHCIQRGESTAT